MNSTALLFVFLSFVVLLFAKKLRQTILIVVVFISIYSIWVIRNYMIFGEFILGSTIRGLAFYYSYAGDYSVFGTPQEESFWEKDYVMRKSKQMSEIESNKYLFNEAINRSLSNPKEFIIKFFIRLFKFYRIYPHRNKMYYAQSETLIILVNIFSYGIIFIFFVYSFLFLIKQFSNYVFLYLPIISFTLVHTITWAVIRYRLQIEPYMIIFSSFIIFRLIYKRV
jgi:hypothetical protein